MARKLSVTAPNGKTYDIEAPDDATDDQIHAEVLRVHPEAAGASDSQDQGGVSFGPDGRLLIDVVGQKEPEQRPTPGLFEDPKGYVGSQVQGFEEGFEKPF